uniref:Uncharacterized protein n=1 Tax=Rhipicephalus pulchellus TaxID=72859 RepID=L7LXT6_RHIPC
MAATSMVYLGPKVHAQVHASCFLPIFVDIFADPCDLMSYTGFLGCGVTASFHSDSPTSCTCHTGILLLSTCTVSCKRTWGLHTCRRGPFSSLLSSSTFAP